MIVGITGGIASGKTYCSSIFERIGTPVYYSDSRAKALMVDSPNVVEQLTALFGTETYLPDGSLNRGFLSKLIFDNKELLQKMNSIVHPAVRTDFMQWAQKALLHHPYILQESALLVETGSYKIMDKLIVVDAPESERVQRVIKRDQVSKEAVLKRMANQLPSETKRSKADYIIDNHRDPNIVEKIMRIHFNLMEIAI